jgi:beta-fructofuranosidase
VVWLDSNRKQLVQWPIKELETLRGKKVQISNQQVKKGEHIEVKGITAAQVINYVPIYTFDFAFLLRDEKKNHTNKYILFNIKIIHF